MNTCIHIHSEYMKSQSIICEGTEETTKVIAGETLNVTETQERKVTFCTAAHKKSYVNTACK